MEKTNATKHYLHYPKGDFPVILAYGFRPIFLILAPYMMINITLWSLFWLGFLPLDFLSDPIKWHVYELLFGVGSGGFMAFLLTGLPELFPGVVPLVGRKLAILVGVWVLARVSFWLIDFVNIYLVAFLNMAPLLFMVYYAFKPVVLDSTQKHSSLAYTLVIIVLLQVYFFAIEAGLVDGVSMDVLRLCIGAFMALILLALRRINMEAVNEWLEDRGIDDVLVVRPPRFNLAIFCIALFSLAEFYFPTNHVLGWLGLASSAAVFGVLSEYKMKDSLIVFEPFVLYLGSIVVMMGLGYGFIGLAYLNPGLGGLNNFRHFLTIGAFGLAFFNVLVIVSYIHTGRHLKAHFSVSIGVILLVASALLRSSIDFLPQFSSLIYALSSLFWIVAFGLYYWNFYPFLTQKRKDGILG